MTASDGHTPGPWLVGLAHTKEDGGDGYFEIEAPVLGVRSEASGDFGRVAVVEFATEADARLMAAAPELLAALKRLVAGLNETTDASALVFRARAALDAIRKAEGDG